MIGFTREDVTWVILSGLQLARNIATLPFFAIVKASRIISVFLALFCFMYFIGVLVLCLILVQTYVPSTFCSRALSVSHLLRVSFSYEKATSLQRNSWLLWYHLIRWVLFGCVRVCVCCKVEASKAKYVRSWVRGLAEVSWIMHDYVGWPCDRSHTCSATGLPAGKLACLCRVSR
jgi:hypothetical protein